MKRKRVNKERAAKSFKDSVTHTKAINLVRAPMRGGWRL